MLHREYTQGGSIGVTLAGGADYESKEITVTIISCSSIYYIILYDRLEEKNSNSLLSSGAQSDRWKSGGQGRQDPEGRSSTLDQREKHQGGQS